MKQFFISLFMLFCLQRGTAQLYDMNWIVGDSAQLYTIANDTIVKTAIPDYVYTYLFWAGISDENGVFQFFTNGFRTYDHQGDTMMNGYDLTDSAYEAYVIDGWGNETGGVIIPRGNGDYLFINHSVSDAYWETGNSVGPDRLYYSEINMNANGGAGAVISKKNLLYDQIMTNTHITANRHANGRDWWVVVNKYADSTYVEFLVTPDTVLGPYLQAIGAPYPGSGNVSGQLMFSPDGSRMAGISGFGDLVIMDFDRCSGLFSNALSLAIPNDTFIYEGSPFILNGGGVSVMFSASGRYLYLSREYDLLQYDLQNPDILSSKKMIYYIDSIHVGALDVGYLTPNGTILIGNVNATHSGFNIIENPDEPDSLCGFIKEDSNLFVFNDICINQTFNYRLGALTGSACDTLTGMKVVGASSIKVKFYPNPATEMTQLDLYTRDLNEPLSFVVYDMVGKEIMRKNIPLYQIQIPRNGVAAGIYTWQVQNDKGQAKAVGKLVWE